MPEHNLLKMGNLTVRAGSLRKTCLHFMPGFHSKSYFASIYVAQMFRNIDHGGLYRDKCDTKIGKSLDLAQGLCNTGQVII